MRKLGNVSYSQKWKKIKSWKLFRRFFDKKSERGRKFDIFSSLLFIETHFNFSTAISRIHTLTQLLKPVKLRMKAKEKTFYRGKYTARKRIFFHQIFYWLFSCVLPFLYSSPTFSFARSLSHHLSVTRLQNVKKKILSTFLGMFYVFLFLSLLYCLLLIIFIINACCVFECIFALESSSLYLSPLFTLLLFNWQ